MSDVFGLRTLPLAIGLLAALADIGPAVGAEKGETIPLTKLQPIDNVPSVRLSPDDRTADFVIPPIYDRPFAFSRYDLPVELDLTGADGLAFDFRCSDPTQLADMSVLFAPADWNKCYWVPFTKVGERDGWSQMTVLREDFSTQGDSADGWRNIRTLRFFLTVNPNVRESVSCAIRNLRVVPVRHPDAEVWIVAGDVTFRERKLNGGYFADLARNHRAALETAGVRTRTVFESDFPTEVPPQVRLVVLPYNQCLPEAAKAALAALADKPQDTDEGDRVLSRAEVAAMMGKSVKAVDIYGRRGIIRRVYLTGGGNQRIQNAPGYGKHKTRRLKGWFYQRHIPLALCIIPKIG